MSSVAVQSNVIPSGTSDGSSRSTQAPAWFKIFDGPEDDAGVRPYGVKVVLVEDKKKNKLPGGWEAKKPGTNAWRGFTVQQKEDAYNHAEVSMTTCPIDGRPVPIGVTQVQTLVNYLMKCHQGEFERLAREAGGHIRTLYVYPDCYSVTRRFINHRFPDMSFETKSQLDMALKTGTPLFPETDCHHGEKCRGIKGGCGFNHPGAGWCDWEKSPTKRCYNKFCGKNHGRGRMKFITRLNNSSSGEEGKSKVVKKKPQTKDDEVKPKSSNPFEGLVDEEEEDVEEDVKEVVEEVQTPEQEEEHRGAADEEGFVTPKKRGSKKPPTAPVKRKSSNSHSNMKSASKRLFEGEDEVQENLPVECVVLKPEDLGMTESGPSKKTSKKTFKKAAQKVPGSGEFPQLSESEVQDQDQESPTWEERIAETRVSDAEALRLAKEKKIEEQTMKLEEERQKLEEAKQKLEEKKRALQEIEDEKKRVQEEMEEQERLLEEEKARKEQEAIEEEEERKRKIQERLDAGVEGLVVIPPKKERELKEAPPKKSSKKAKKQGKNKGEKVFLHFG